MIFLPLIAARHGVESCCAIRSLFACCSSRSLSSSWPNLNPCCCARAIVHAQSASQKPAKRAPVIGIETEGACGDPRYRGRRLAQRLAEIHTEYSTRRLWSRHCGRQVAPTAVDEDHRRCAARIALAATGKTRCRQRPHGGNEMRHSVSAIAVAAALLGL